MYLLVGIFAIIIGLINIIKPDFAWYMKEGWKVDGDSEPSDTYISLAKLGGVFTFIVGLLMVIYILFT